MLLVYFLGKLLLFLSLNYKFTFYFKSFTGKCESGSNNFFIFPPSGSVIEI